MAVDVPADPTLNALLVATATEDWPAWYGCTRLAVADYLEDRNLPGDPQGAALVRRAQPQAWAQCPVRPGWEVEEVRLCRDSPAGAPSSWVRVTVDGHGWGDDAFSRLAKSTLAPGTQSTLFHDRLRPFPLRALRLSAVILDESEVSAAVFLRPVAGPEGYSRRWADLRLTPWDARLWCRRGVLGLFAGVLVRAPCPHCRGKGKVDGPAFSAGAAGGRAVMRLHHTSSVGLCPVCRGRTLRPRPAPSLLPTLPAVALPALAQLN